MTGRQEEEVAEEEAGAASLPRRTGLLVGRRRIRCRKVTGGEDAKDEGAEDEESTPRGVSRWAQPLPVLATSAASREREALSAVAERDNKVAHVSEGDDKRSENSVAAGAHGLGEDER